MRAPLRAVALLAVLLAALLSGCADGGDAGPARTPLPTARLPEEDEGPVAPGVPAPGRGPFVDAETGDLWAVLSSGCGCPDAHQLVAYYRDGGVLAATYRIEGNSVTTTNRTRPYQATLQALFDRANPWGTHDEGAQAGRGDRGVRVENVWTGTLAQSDLDAVGGFLTGAVRDARDAPTAPTVDCLCEGRRIETYGGFQGRADEALDQELDPRWAPVAQQMQLLGAWIRP